MTHRAPILAAVMRDHVDHDKATACAERVARTTEDKSRVWNEMQDEVEQTEIELICVKGRVFKLTGSHLNMRVSASALTRDFEHRRFTVNTDHTLNLRREQRENSS